MSKEGLVPEKRPVHVKSKVIQRTYWVKPEDAAHAPKVAAQISRLAEVKAQKLTPSQEKALSRLKEKGPGGKILVFPKETSSGIGQKEADALHKAGHIDFQKEGYTNPQTGRYIEFTQAVLRVPAATKDGAHPSQTERLKAMKAQGEHSEEAPRGDIVAAWNDRQKMPSMEREGSRMDWQRVLRLRGHHEQLAAYAASKTAPLKESTLKGKAWAEKAMEGVPEGQATVDKAMKITDIALRKYSAATASSHDIAFWSAAAAHTEPIFQKAQRKISDAHEAKVKELMAAHAAAQEAADDAEWKAHKAAKVAKRAQEAQEAQEAQAATGKAALVAKYKAADAEYKAAIGSAREAEAKAKRSAAFAAALTAKVGT